MDHVRDSGVPMVGRSNERIPSADGPAGGAELRERGDPDPCELEDGPEVLLDPLERLKFKMERRHLRSFPAHHEHVALWSPASQDEHLTPFASRRSHRKFAARSVALRDLAGLLGTLMQVSIEGVPLPKSRYGSAGSLYPVQVYLYVREGKVEGLPSGTYYYQPLAHQLVSISRKANLGGRVFGSNQAIFNAASFAIFLVAEMQAVRPLYGESSRDFCMLEAGAMSQLLECSAPAHHLGVCQIGEMDTEAVHAELALDEEHLYLHGLLAGPIDPSQTTVQALVEDSEDIRMMLELLDAG